MRTVLHSQSDNAQLLFFETEKSKFNELNTVKTQEVFMNYECKITVLETKVFPELQEKYLGVIP